MRVGYVRVSTVGQNTARQEVLMEELGAERVYIDRMSGKNTSRPALRQMLEFVREGDVVVVESISRFARNTRDLLELVEQLSAKGVEFVSKKEAIDTMTPPGKFMLTIFGAVAELEREGLVLRQTRGTNRYRALLQLTEQGKTIAARVDELAGLAVEKASGTMSDEQRFAMYAALDLIARNLQTICHEGLV